MKNKFFTGLSCRVPVIIFIVTAMWSSSKAVANNLQISNVSLAGQNTVTNISFVKFDINWDNSWRTSVGPSNWDAAWLFIKYRIKTQSSWKHATLNWVNGSGAGDGHIVPPGATISGSNDNGAGGSHGVFIYHSSDMLQSPVSYPGVQLCWNYGADGVSDADSVEICVMGIEMVYVPQGGFMTGDGTTVNVAGQLHDASGSGNPYPITSENAITLGEGAPGSVGNNNGNGMQLAWDDFNNATSQILPAAFPKGFRAFYCMKYELSQEQYVVFLNKLNYHQQATRTQGTTPPNSATGTNVLTFFGTPYRNSVAILTPGTSPGIPAVYACNLNGNGSFNEPDDGHNIACNNLSWADLTAYLDWSALRPMTELEYEKACRGDQLPAPEEFAWGNTSMNIVSAMLNSGQPGEVPGDPNANCNNTDWTAMGGPVRVGCFGTGIGTRIASGSTYYGIMEMSGNLWERTITVGNTSGRAFTHTHGDGVLSMVMVPGLLNIGDANTATWPDNTADGSGFRGGAWYFPDPQAATVSYRIYATSGQPLAGFNFGGRGVRTAPN